MKDKTLEGITILATSPFGTNGTTLSNNVIINKGCFSSPPKVIPEPPLALDQQCVAAMSRLKVAIEANAAYHKKQMTDSYLLVINSYFVDVLNDITENSFNFYIDGKNISSKGILSKSKEEIDASMKFRSLNDNAWVKKTTKTKHRRTIRDQENGSFSL